MSSIPMCFFKKLNNCPLQASGCTRKVVAVAAAAVAAAAVAAADGAEIAAVSQYVCVCTSVPA